MNVSCLVLKALLLLLAFPEHFYVMAIRSIILSQWCVYIVYFPFLGVFSASLFTCARGVLYSHFYFTFEV